MKLKSTIIFFLCTSAAVTAQNLKTSKVQSSGFEMVKKETRGFKKYDLRDLNKPKMVNSPFGHNGTAGNSASGSARSASNIEPFAEIDIPRWGVINKVEGGGEILFSSERTGTSYTVKTYNDNIEIVDNFTIQVPANANQIDVLNHYSSGFFNNNAAREFMIFVQHFDPEKPGPEGMIWEVWVVDSAGQILKKLDGTGAETKIDADGKKKLFSYLVDNNALTLNAFDIDTWKIENTYVVDAKLTNFFMGSPLNFLTVDGQEYIALAHYKHLFMDNDTFEVFPDNNLIVKLLDHNLQEVKKMSLDIETRYPDAGPYVIPMADFGTFYRDQTYDLSRHIFNNDDKLEVVYGVYYYDMIGDTEWSTYRVANEDGQMIHELNEYLLDTYQEMNSIEGHDNQLAFLMGEDGMATNLAFFNIESWKFDLNLNADHNGDRLSSSFNRVPQGSDFNYVIGLGEPDEENGNIYGVVNHYDRTGKSTHRQRFLLPENTVLFQPILTPYALLPNLFANDNAFYYNYVYKQMGSDGKVFNNLVISKDTEEHLVEFRGDTNLGNIIGSTFLTDGNSVFNKMTVQYESGYDQMLTQFYKLPFETDLNVQNPSTSDFSVYPNPTAEVLNFETAVPVTAIKVYGLAGNLVLNQIIAPYQKSIHVSRLSAGVYVAVVSLQDGSARQIKFIKK